MFFCKTAPFLGQKQTLKRRMVCKLLSLYGLDSTNKGAARRIGGESHLTEEAAGLNTIQWPQKGTKSAEELVVVRLLRLFAAIHLAPCVSPCHRLLSNRCFRHGIDDGD